METNWTIHNSHQFKEIVQIYILPQQEFWKTIICLGIKASIDKNFNFLLTLMPVLTETRLSSSLILCFLHLRSRNVYFLGTHFLVNFKVELFLVRKLRTFFLPCYIWAREFVVQRQWSHTVLSLISFLFRSTLDIRTLLVETIDEWIISKHL